MCSAADKYPIEIPMLGSREDASAGAKRCSQGCASCRVNAAVVDERAEGGPYHRLHVGVEVHPRLVDDEHVRVGEERASEMKELPISSRERRELRARVSLQVLA